MSTTEPAEGDDRPDFEAAMEELEGLVERMESGDLSLEDALAAFERGIRLTRHCQQALAAAEQRVSVLMENADGQFASAPFDASDAPDGKDERTGEG